MADPAMSGHTDLRWLGTWPPMPEPLPLPPADGRPPPQRLGIAQPVPSTAPAAPPRRPSTRWSGTTSRTFLAEAQEAGPMGWGVPRWVERDFRSYLRCGILAHGFARVRCRRGARLSLRVSEPPPRPSTSR